MGLSGGMDFCKKLMMFFNIIFFLVGMALIITGALVKTEFNQYFQFYEGSANHLAVGLMVIGGIIFIIAFFGCCGAWKENSCMVKTFALLLILIMVLQIIIGITAYVVRKPVEEEITEKMVASMDNYEVEEAVTKVWDSFQKDFKCCGTNSPADWFGKQNFTNTTTAGKVTLPDSCCKVETELCGVNALLTTFNEVGCKDGFVNMVKTNVEIVGGVCIGLAFIQIFGILLACCLARSINSQYEAAGSA